MNWFQVARLAIPVIKESIAELYHAKSLQSEGGTQITKEEWEGFAKEVSLKVGECVFREIMRRKDVIDSDQT